MTVELPAGDHCFKVVYSDYGWTDTMVLWYSGPDTSEAKVIVPDSAFVPDGCNACSPAPAKCSSFTCADGSASPFADKDCPEGGCTQSHCCNGPEYDQLSAKSACGVTVDGEIQFHERCQCARLSSESDVMPFCKESCDADPECKGYVERPLFGWQTCQIATTSACPREDCKKFNEGSVGPIVEVVPETDDYKGCFVKRKTSLLEASLLEQGFSFVRRHSMRKPCDATVQPCHENS